MILMLKAFWKPLLVGGLIFLALWGFSHIRYQAGYQAADLAWQLESADKRAGELAEYADRARIAGLTCEKTYDGIARNTQ